PTSFFLHASLSQGYVVSGFPRADTAPCDCHAKTHSRNAATRARDALPGLRTALSSDAIPSRIAGPSYIDFAFLRAASPRRAHRPSSLSSRTQASAFPISSSQIRISFSAANDSPSAPTVVDPIAFPWPAASISFTRVPPPFLSGQQTSLVRRYNTSRSATRPVNSTFLGADL